MNERKNLHEGHRERLTQKFLDNPNGTPDHELLEILLFETLPRVDTNGIAHVLLDNFGDLSRVFDADPKDLMAIDGIGEKTARKIALTGQIVKAIGKKERKEKRFSFSFEKNKQMAREYFSGYYVEGFVFLLLDATYKVLAEISATDYEKKSVKSNACDIAKAMARLKPKYALILHNHPSGKCQPSIADDTATGKINVLCEAHGVTLLDHIVVGKNEEYSYYANNRLDFIRREYSFDKENY